ncbi:MAG: hypothetical protein LBE36_13515 [Flavobacteriaceae bacterium]|jgi:hypothetical protein|nr:hypothetical protein [Flavobacteriaceae bacterium]
MATILTLFDIGDKVKNNNGISGTIIAINIFCLKDRYAIQYTIETGEIVLPEGDLMLIDRLGKTE